MSNTRVWDSFSRPPSSALKRIGGGRLKGMTDINPQWRYRAMTEQFGPCGIGWKYTINKLWTEPGVGEERLAFADVSLYIKAGDSWSEAIPGIGGSASIAIESSGPRASDECYKMAITDALSVAMKVLGVASDIYMGLWDGSKYKDPIPEGKGVIKPTDGAMETQSPEMQRAIQKIADGVNVHMATDRVYDAYELISQAAFDADQMVALWSLIPNPTYRSKLKEWHAEVRKRDDEMQAMKAIHKP